MPGTDLPGVIAAGTYYWNGRNFLDVMNRKQTIVVELENEYYKKLIIDVKDPQAAVELLNQK
ncbi:hypothetical protein [Flavobacterium sp. 3HN19-14]|uniref:hypothetical protein n=1 Tax=Flavobacterium sp. 3HN19-14 TaxID=3448133 RepID=UPI003EE36C27